MADRLPPYLPSDVRLLVPAPLGNTMHKAEAEFAAAIVVLVCQLDGDRWQPVTGDRMAAVLREQLAAGTQLGRFFGANPFVRPSPNELVDRGYARWVDDRTVELTAAAFEAMRPWVSTR